MTAVRECHCVSLAARDRHDFLVVKGLNARRIRLVRLILRVLWQIPDVVQTELSESGLAPGVYVSLSRQRHRMRIATSQLSDDQAMQAFDFLWHRHERAPIDIQWHLEDVPKA